MLPFVLLQAVDDYHGQVTNVANSLLEEFRYLTSSFTFSYLLLSLRIHVHVCMSFLPATHKDSQSEYTNYSLNFNVSCPGKCLVKRWWVVIYRSLMKLWIRGEHCCLFTLKRLKSSGYFLVFWCRAIGSFPTALTFYARKISVTSTCKTWIK